MKRVAVTKREAAGLAKQIAAAWIREKNAKAGTVAKEIDQIFPTLSLAEQIVIVDRVTNAIEEFHKRLDPIVGNDTE